MLKKSSDESVENKPAPKKGAKYLWLLLAWTCIGAGTVGIFLPGIPTTPFILLAAWAATKSSPELEHWILTHPRFGPLIDNWQQHRAIPRAAKFSGVLLMSISWSVLWWAGSPTILLWLTGLFFLIGLCFLFSLKSSEGIE